MAKRILSVILAFMMLFCIVSCGKEKDNVSSAKIDDSIMNPATDIDRLNGLIYTFIDLAQGGSFDFDREYPDLSKWSLSAKEALVLYMKYHYPTADCCVFLRKHDPALIPDGWELNETAVGDIITTPVDREKVEKWCSAFLGKEVFYRSRDGEEIGYGCTYKADGDKVVLSSAKYRDQSYNRSYLGGFYRPNNTYTKEDGDIYAFDIMKLVNIEINPDAPDEEGLSEPMSLTEDDIYMGAIDAQDFDSEFFTNVRVKYYTLRFKFEDGYFRPVSYLRK